MGVYAHYHRDSRLHILLRYSVGHTRKRPLLSSEVSHAYPSLVYVDDGLVHQVDLEESERAA